MMKYTVFFVILIISPVLLAQQLSIPRIDQMPDFPQPYLMRDWKAIATAYDSLVYNESASGEFLPLIETFNQTLNYPAHPSFGLHSYVGTGDPGSGEAINVLPSLIGATLCGIDKSNQFGKNWIQMSEEFFNKASGEDIYLNNPGGVSGSDWWYETMPNVFFYQLHELYPHNGDFDYQFTSVANRWMEAVRAMGGNAAPWTVPEMTYRAWNLNQMEALNEGVPEPEAAGALAWIFYAAYIETGRMEYRNGAEWCMEYLDKLEDNPSYELQLAYGTFIAARMNAELGTSYDLEKMLNWCFDIGSLRNWGAIVGNWGGLDCSGLIGEQSEGAPGYAFNMNGLQQAAALMPLVRYDDRFALSLGKWLLNLANASRLFYSSFLPAEKQDAADWSALYDPLSLIGYEALKESKNGQAPFATGDALGGGWAETNLALYGSSHVGMLGGIVKITNVEGILQTDLLKTDYYKKGAYPTYLYYNPHTIEHEVDIQLAAGSYDIYESTVNTVLATGRSGVYKLVVGAKKAAVIVLLPAGLEITFSGKQTLAGSIIIDFNNGIPVDNYPPRIKALASKDSLFIAGSEQLIYCTAEDRDGDSIKYSWSGTEGPWSDEAEFLWQVPDSAGYYTLGCMVRDINGAMDSMLIRLHAVDRFYVPPVIHSLNAAMRKLHPGMSTEVHCLASDMNNDILTYQWSSGAGSISGEGSTITWKAPAEEGDYTIFCTLTNLDSLSAGDSLRMMVRDSGYSQDGKLLASFQMNNNALDFSSYHNNGTPLNIYWTEDRSGVPGYAASFNGDNSMIRVANKEYLNFTDGLSVTAWIRPAGIGATEQFIVSHGSWQNRWKVSISNGYLRFTINGSEGIADIDSRFRIRADIWQHFAAIYNGRDMEVYLNDSLSSFKAWTGTIHTSSSDLTIGQMIPGDASYNYEGLIDDLRIFNYGLDQRTIGKIYTNEISSIPAFELDHAFTIYPNPAGEWVNILLQKNEGPPDAIQIFSVTGSLLWMTRAPETFRSGNEIKIPTGQLQAGIYFISILKQRELQTQKLILN